MKPTGNEQLRILSERKQKLQEEVAQFRRYCQDWEEQKEAELAKLAQDYADLYRQLTATGVILPLHPEGTGQQEPGQQPEL